MARFFGPAILDFGLDVVRARIAAGNTVKLHLIRLFVIGDSYPDVIANSLGSVALAQPDLTLADQGSHGRQVTVAAKTIAAASANSGPAPDLHIAILDETASEILIVNDETTDQVITAGNPVNTFAFPAKLNQPPA